MIEQAELNRAFLGDMASRAEPSRAEPSRAEPSFLGGMASRAEIVSPKAQAKTEPSQADFRLGPNTKN